MFGIMIGAIGSGILSDKYDRHKQCFIKFALTTILYFPRLEFYIFTLLETLVIFYIFDDHYHPQVWSKEDLLGGLFGNHRLWVVHLPFLVHAGLCHDDDYNNADADHGLMLLTYDHLKIMVVFTYFPFPCWSLMIMMLLMMINIH